ncbi:MAG: hypothetical protein ACPGXX_03135 [Planctomycetaceae bacterium]
MAGQRRGIQRLRKLFLERTSSFAGLLLLISLGIAGGLGALPTSFVVWSLALLVCFEFQREMDRGVPFVHLASLVAVLQWLVGPWLAYRTEAPLERYRMYVPADEYFSYAIPGVVAYVTGLLVAGLTVSPRKLISTVGVRKFPSIGIWLAVVGGIAELIRDENNAGALGFALALCSNLRYVGALYFFYSGRSDSTVLGLLCFVPLILVSASKGYFHDLLLWSSISFVYWFGQRKRSVGSKFFIIGSGFLFVFFLQSVKQEIRGRDSNVVSMTTLIVERFMPWGSGWRMSNFEAAVVRLNQGWIVSAVMENMPANTDFVGGETFLDAFRSALLPRILDPTKKGADGRINFRSFTGLEIADSTSMAVSPLGEAYANFGAFFGVLCLLINGVFLGFCVRLSVRLCVNHPTFVFWLPLIFYQALKAETESIVVLNQITKGTLVSISMYLVVIKLYPITGRLMLGRRRQQIPSVQGGSQV